MAELNVEKATDFHLDHWRWQSHKAIALEQVRRLGFNGERSADILDIGFGEYNLATSLSSLGDVDAIDLNFAGQPEPQVNGKQRHIGKRYDLITALNVLGDVNDDEQSLKEMCSLLRPGGKLLISAAAHGVWVKGNESFEEGRRRYNLVQMKKLLGNYGQLRRIGYIHGLDLVVRLAEGIGSRLGLQSIAGGGSSDKFNHLMNELLMAEYKSTRYIPLLTGTIIMAVVVKPVVVRTWRPMINEQVIPQSDLSVAA